MAVQNLYREDSYSHPTPGLIYIDTSCVGTANAEEFIPEGCCCQGRCTVQCCTCLKRSGGYYVDHKLITTTGNPIFECNDDCSCDSTCPNKVIQHGPLSELEINPMSGKGFGVVSKVQIPQGSFVCEYAGEIIGIEEGKRRFSVQRENQMNYILVMREHSASSVPVITVVDPSILGNIGRYLNHSCNPNLKVVPVRIQSCLPIAALFATRDIHVGEELCYDYESFDTANCPQFSQGTENPNLNPDVVLCSNGEQTSSCVCVCLSSNCRGFLPKNINLFVH